jgi:hypothetical protein
VSFDPRTRLEVGTISRFRDASFELISSLRTVWSDTSFRVSRGRSSPPTVTTEASSSNSRLPLTRRLIRGAPGVKVTATEYTSSWNGQPRLHDAVSDTLVRASLGTGDQAEGLGQVQEAYSSLVERVLSDQKLAQILYESRGFKHYEPAEVEAVIAARDEQAREAMSFAVIPVVEDALNGAGLQWEQLQNFDGWNRAAEILSATLEAISQRTHHEYAVTAYLNGPLLDQHEPAK